MTIKKLLGSYKIRELQKDEVYFCQEGCGDCEKVTTKEDNLLRTTAEGKLLEWHFSMKEVSKCCKSSIGIWNTATDEEINVEYTFIPEKPEQSAC